jgi:CheY-like chemotaxis protein
MVGVFAGPTDGAGQRHCVTLPLTGTPCQAARPESDVRLALPVASGSTGTLFGMPISVLVVDDDDAFRRLTVRMLDAMGFTVAGEADGVATALAAAEELRPDAALVDVRLADGDGSVLALRLATLPWRPRVVLVSSDADAISADDVDRLGVRGFVPKADLPTALLQDLLTSG